ncbi:glycosyltransferase family 4 protein [Candidatus Beckwithbacteria bacterium]|nr:glycosyltransferase family 4 protein [Candidatus Beckwithbacteria bacterium]
MPLGRETLHPNTEQLVQSIVDGERINSPFVASAIFNLARIQCESFSKETIVRQPPKVALVIPYHPLYEIGGLEIGTRKLAQGLKVLGHHTEIIAKGIYEHSDQRGTQISPEGIVVHGVGAGIEDIISYLLKRRSDFDIVQWMEVFPPIPETPETYNDKAEQQYLASILLRTLGINTYLSTATSGSITRRGVNQITWQSSKKHQPLNALLNCAMTGYIGANSDIALEYSEAGLTKPQMNFEMVPFGVDDEHFKPCSKKEKQHIRTRLGIPIDKTVILFIGRFVQRKQPDVLINIWKTLPLDIQEKGYLVFIGGGAGQGQPDSIYNEVCIQIDNYNKQRITQGLGVGIHIFNKVPHDQMPTYIQACDSFFFPSTREGLPLVIPEVMACGKPVFASNIPGIREVISDPEIGIMFDPNNPKQIRDYLIDFISNPCKYASFGKTAREHVKRYWNWHSIASKLSNVYCKPNKLHTV